MIVRQHPVDPRQKVHDFIYRHHIEHRVQLYVPKGETLPIPLKYIDVTRTGSELNAWW